MQPTYVHAARPARGDLVVEVLSPRPRIGDIGERVMWFAGYGVTEAWLVRQMDRRVEVLAFEQGRVAAECVFAMHERLVSKVLPAFDLSLSMISGW